MTSINAALPAAESGAARNAYARSGNRTTSISQRVLRGAVRAFDFLIITALGLLIAHVYVNEVGILTDINYLIGVPAIALLTVGVFQLFGLYSLAAFASYLTRMPKIVIGWTMTFAAVTALVFLFKIGAEVSRVWLAGWYLAGVPALAAARLVLGWRVRAWARAGRLYQRAAIYGAGGVTEKVISELDADVPSTVRIVGVFDDRDDDRAPRTIAGYTRLGGIDELIAMSRAERFDIIILALPLSAESRLTRLARRLSVLPVDIKMPAQSSAVRFSPKVYSHIGRVAMIDLYDKPIADWGVVSKLVFDKIVATLAIILLAPVIAAVALAVKLDSRGPVLFRQRRYGFNNELIEIFKFRSMHVDKCDAAAVKLVTKGDPRVTRVGRFIRKSSLDELPQLFNVLRGDLSLVGPRPHAMQAKAGDHLYGDVIDGYFARHKVRPGITGWAQIHGWRGETDTEEKIVKRVEHDLYYIENWSVLLDIAILLKTPLSLLKTDNAY